MRHLSMTNSVLLLSRGRRNQKLFELVSLWHPTPGALEVDALLKLCLSSLQGQSFGLLPQAPDRSANIHHTFQAMHLFAACSGITIKNTRSHKLLSTFKLSLFKSFVSLEQHGLLTRRQVIRIYQKAICLSSMTTKSDLHSFYSRCFIITYHTPT